MREGPSSERSFGKYAQFGAYHWEAFSRDPRRRDCFTRARYMLTEKAVRGHVRSGRILDLGCGDGALLNWVARWNADAHLTGVEPNAEGRRIADAQLTKAGISVPVLESMEQVERHSQDAVLCSDVIEHVRDDGAFLASIARALKPGGLAVLTTPIRRHDVPDDPEHFREYTFDGFRAVVAGFFDVTEHWAFTPAYAFALYTWTPRWARGRTPGAWVVGLLDLFTGFNAMALRCGTPSRAINQLLVAVKPGARTEVP